MSSFSTWIYAPFVALLGLCGSVAGWAQAPAIASLTPLANATAASRTGAVVATFSQPLTGSSTGALKVFSKQRGGLLTAATPAVVNGSNLAYAPLPARPFLPGETVFSTVTTAAASASGSLLRPRVFQFTVAVGATGTGTFQAPSLDPDPAISANVTRAVAVGDLDGDGDLDFACCYDDNAHNGFLSVRLNNGAGRFTTPAAGATTAVGGNLTPVAMALGDVDGDGDLDVVTANFDGATVSILLNDGSAHFTAPAVNPNPRVGNYASGLALGDIDGDGDLDLLCASGSGPGGVSVRLNNGAGNFIAPGNGAAEVLTNGGANSVVLGDVDGDGDLDFVAANEYSNTVSVRLNDGTGVFTAPATTPTLAVGQRPREVVLGDFDADGDLDLATANFDGTASVRLNGGAGGFAAGLTPELALGRGTNSLAACDVDGDGDLDLLASDQYDYVVRVRVNDGRGSFSVPSAYVGSVATAGRPLALAMGDVDGDGDVDLLAAVEGGVSVRLNGVPQVLTGVQPAANAQAVSRSSPVRATFSQPLASGASTLQVHSLVRGGLRTSTTPAVLSSNTLTYTPPAAQPYLPGETLQSIVTAAGAGTGNLGRPRVTQFTAAVGGTGTGRFLVPPVAANGTVNLGSNYLSSMASGDVDGDGDLDFLVATLNAVVVRLNDGRGIYTTPAMGGTLALPGAFLPTLADMDGDGDLDLLAGGADASGTGCVSLSLNNGSGTFAAPAYHYIDGAISSLVVGDFDGSGTLDFVATKGGNFGNFVSIRLNNGNGTFTDPYAGSGGPRINAGAGALALGDVDSDGDLDIVVSCTSGSSIDGLGILLNDGTGNFSESAGAPFIPLFSPRANIVLGDIDGDGDLDLLATSVSDYITVFFNNGTGRFTAQPAAAALFLSNLVHLTLGDVDHDGDLDLLALSGTPRNTTNNGLVYERLNDGRGNFTAPPVTAQSASVQVDKYPSDLAMGDVDGDGDSDVLTTGGIDVVYGGAAATVSVRLNGGTGLATTTARALGALSLFPNPATGRVQVTGATPGQPLEVLDIVGHQVAVTAPMPSETIWLVLPGGLAPGIYVVRCGMQTQRLVVE